MPEYSAPNFWIVSAAESRDGVRLRCGRRAACCQEKARREDRRRRPAELQPVRSVPAQRREEDALHVPEGDGARFHEREDRRRGRRRSGGRRGDVLGGSDADQENQHRSERRKAHARSQRSVPGVGACGTPSASPTNGTNRTGRTAFSV